MPPKVIPPGFNHTLSHRMPATTTIAIFFTMQSANGGLSPVTPSGRSDASLSFLPLAPTQPLGCRQRSGSDGFYQRGRIRGTGAGAQYPGRRRRSARSRYGHGNVNRSPEQAAARRGACLPSFPVPAAAVSPAPRGECLAPRRTQCPE